MALNVILWPGAANPNVVILHDPFASNSTISPTGIPSAEAFGTPAILTGTVTISPTGIASAEAFGTPAIIAGGVILQVTGIPSQEAFGLPVITQTGGTQTVTCTGIGSEEAFGTPTITGGAQPVPPVPPFVVVCNPRPEIGTAGSLNTVATVGNASCSPGLPRSVGRASCAPGIRVIGRPGTCP